MTDPTSDLRKKDLILYYRYKRIFLYLDEWGLYVLMSILYLQQVSLLIILPIMLYGGIGIYTSYKNLEMIESKITGIDQEIYAYHDLYSLFKILVKQNGLRIIPLEKYHPDTSFKSEIEKIIPLDRSNISSLKSEIENIES